MKKLITLTTIILCTFGALFAETPENRKENPHEIRLGYGENSHELLHADSKQLLGIGGHNNIYQTGHIFAEYQHRINNWFSAGCNIDYILSWRGPRNHKDRTITFSDKITILPTARFTYLNYEMLSLYSSVSAGLHITYTHNIYPQKNINNGWGIGFDACLLGLSIGKNHWFGAFELGATTAMTFKKEKNEIITVAVIENHDYTADPEFYIETTSTIPLARLLRISVGYRF